MTEVQGESERGERDKGQKESEEAQDKDNSEAQKPSTNHTEDRVQKSACSVIIKIKGCMG